MKSNLGLRGLLFLGMTLWGLFLLSVGAQTPPLPQTPELLGVRPGVTTLDGLKQIPAFQKLFRSTLRRIRPCRLQYA